MFLKVLVGHFRNLTFGKLHFPSAGWGGRRCPANSLSRWFLTGGFTFACIWFVQIDGSCRRSGISVVFVQAVLNILRLHRYPVMEWRSCLMSWKSGWTCANCCLASFRVSLVSSCFSLAKRLSPSSIASLALLQAIVSTIRATSWYFRDHWSISSSVLGNLIWPFVAVFNCCITAEFAWSFCCINCCVWRLRLRTYKFCWGFQACMIQSRKLWGVLWAIFIGWAKIKWGGFGHISQWAEVEPGLMIGVF